MTPPRHTPAVRAGLAALLLPVLLAAACGPRRAAEAPADPESPEAALCRAEARGSPEVRRLARELNADNQQNALRVGEERRIAEIRAFRDCMRRRGAAMPGGVEPVRQSF